MVGVGGAGGNAISNMIASKLRGVEFFSANTDIQALDRSTCSHRIQLGVSLTKGLGAGGDPEVGRLSAEENTNEIKEAVKGADMVFITAGMGGGTGTGACPVVAQLCKEEGALTVAVVTKPFKFEGDKRKREQSLGTVASAVTVITSDQLRRYGYRTLAEALRGVAGVFVVDDRMIERIGVRGIQLLGDANTRILVLIDGTPLHEPWAQFVDGSTALPVSIDDVARIEVIRGPVSSIYGTNAFFGIMNIVTLESDRAATAYGPATVDSFGELGGNAAFNSGDLNRQVRGTVSFRRRLALLSAFGPCQVAGIGLLHDALQRAARQLLGAADVDPSRLGHVLPPSIAIRLR